MRRNTHLQRLLLCYKVPTVQNSYIARASYSICTYALSCPTYPVKCDINPTIPTPGKDCLNIL